MKKKRPKLKVIKGKGKPYSKPVNELEDDMRLKELGGGLMSNILTIIEERFSMEQQKTIMSEIEKESEGALTPTQKSFYWFLLGFLEYKKNNYGNNGR